ncbi:hypothetical protein J1N35_042065 [Gossypium stocksii]|uniref:Uncharacterized protein n=1 Tax=Gossypium stocksii TaxID=47602 RepID=A0A9D3UGM8_9ROSI|nr:hypothetical protein J1N35_042065 [Gossypium stocksii]
MKVLCWGVEEASGRVVFRCKRLECRPLEKSIEVAGQLNFHGDVMFETDSTGLEDVSLSVAHTTTHQPPHGCVLSTAKFS